MTITELSIKRPSFIIVIFAALMLLGLFSYKQLNYELLPSISIPYISVTTVYPGASPQEVETSVSKVIEDALSGIDNVVAIRTTSLENVSFVMVELTNEADLNISLQDANRKTNEVMSKLPAGSKAPILSKIGIDELPVLRVAMTSDLSPRDLTKLLKDKIKPELAKVAGVSQISIIGGEEREVRVNLDKDKINSYGLSILQIVQVVKMNNLDFPTGKIKDDDAQFVVRVAGKLSSLDQLRALPVGTSRNGSTIFLRDVAEVIDGANDPTNITRFSTQSTIALYVNKQADANAVDVAQNVRARFAELEKRYSDSNLKFTVAQDGSLFTVDAAEAVKVDLVWAVILVALVMLLFLHSFRNSLIILIAIPASLISTFIAMYALGFSLNLMTLLGLSLVVGILVDDSIVVLENIYHHLEKGEEKRIAAVKGRNEIGFAALAITLVDVAVFLPLSLVDGLVGNIMRQFALVVVFSTLMSLFVSFTLTPMLASRFAKLEKLTNKTIIGKFANWFENYFQRLTKYYISTLKWSFNNKKKVVGATIVLFVLANVLPPFGFIGSEFLSPADRGEFAITLELTPGTKLEETNLVSEKIERALHKLPEVTFTLVNVGASNEGLIGFAQSNVSEINVKLVPKNERSKSSDDVMQDMKKILNQYPGLKYRLNPIGIMGTANQTPIQIVFSGTDNESVLAAADTVVKIVKKIPGSSDVRLSSEKGNPETRIDIDREKLSYFGLSLAEVGTALRVALTGDDESKLRDGNDEYSIRIMLDEFDRANTEDISKITFANRKGQLIELSQFASVTRALGPTKLQREDRNPSVVLYSQAVGRPSGSIAADIETELQKTKLPDGVKYIYGGDVKNQNESFGSLGLALLAAFILTYLIMVALYDSFIYPFVVLFSVPLAIIGALFALALVMKTLNIFTILGLIMLVGLVGKNAILLVDRTNAARGEGLSVNDALLDAGEKRIRPIMMTTLTMIFGMLPIALTTGAGSELKSGLAWALIGGLTSSLFLTLIIVPIVYSYIESLRVRIPAFIKSKFRRKEKVIALQEA